MSAFTWGIRTKGAEALTLEEIEKTVPAIFAAEAHESRSDRYVYISTRDVVDRLIGEGFMPVEARLTRTRDAARRSHAKHMIRFRADPGLTTKARAVGDTSFEITLRNGHDGSAAYEFFAGLFRLVCLNGMTVSDGTVASVHVRHSGNRERVLEQVAEGAHAVLEQAPRVLEAPRLWPTLGLSRDEQMAFAEAAHSVRFADAALGVSTPILAEQLLHARRPADQGDDLWHVFNRVQENVTRGGISATGVDHRGRPRRSTTREVHGIDGDIKLNRALWTLASEMARIKQGQV